MVPNPGRENNDLDFWDWLGQISLFLPFFQVPGRDINRIPLPSSEKKRRGRRERKRKRL